MARSTTASGTTARRATRSPADARPLVLDTPEGLARLDAGLIARMAARLAQRQQAAAVAPPTTPAGRVVVLRRDLDALVQHLRERLVDAVACSVLDDLHRDLDIELARQAPRIAARRSAGRVRQGQGDLRLARWSLVPASRGRTETLAHASPLVATRQPRWRDVADELAAPFADLHRLGHDDLAWRLLGHWLQHTGDLDAPAVLPLFAAVHALGHGAGAGEHRTVVDQMMLARRLVARRLPVLVVMTGLAGSGKSTAAALLAGALGAVWLHDESIPLPPPSAPAGVDLEADPRLQPALRDAARALLAAGQSVIVDSAALTHDHRIAWLDLADDAGAVGHLVECHAPLSRLRQRLEAIERAAPDAPPPVPPMSEMIFGRPAGAATAARLAWQLYRIEPLNAAELARATPVSTDGDLATLQRICAGVAESIREMADVQDVLPTAWRLLPP